MTYAEWGLTGLGGRRARGRSARQGGEGKGKGERRKGEGREGGEGTGARVKESRSLSGYAGPRPGLRTRAGVRTSLAQANIFPPGGAAWMWVTGDVGSSPAPSLRREKKRLKVKCPPGACPSHPGPPGPPTTWPRAQEVQARWMGPSGPLRPGPAPSAYLRLPPEAAAAAATAAAEVEAVGLGAQARCGSYPRRSTRMEKAGGGRSRSLCNNFISNHQRRTRTVTRQQAGGQ